MAAEDAENHRTGIGGGNGRRVEAAVKKLLKDAFAGLPQEFEMELLDMPDIGWKCDCSEERLEQVVLSLGAKEIRNIIEEDGEAELTASSAGNATGLTENI